MITGDLVQWAGKNQLQFTAFSVGVAQELSKFGILDPDHIDATDPAVREVIEAFHHAYDLNSFLDAMTALDSFVEFLPTWDNLAKYRKVIENGSIRVTVSIPGKSGSVISIELGEDYIESATQYTINRTVLKLSDMARKAYLSLIDARGNFGVQPSANGADDNAAAPGSQRHPVVGIIKSREKNKDYYKVLLGEWTKHGVRVWEEVLQSSGIDFEALPYETTPATGYGTLKYTADGKPEKLTSLEIKL